MVSVFRVTLAVVVFLATSIPLMALTRDMGSTAQLAAGLCVMFAVSLVLPHYFYRGEPLLPDRQRRPHQSG
jgi:hypothetical protein